MIMRNEAMNVLLKMGMPARIKGLTYICDAIELFDTDPYYQDGKICSLYLAIAKRHNTTASSVERAIRHAFETTLNKGDSYVIQQYIDLTNTQNSNLLRSLYFRLKQDASQCQCADSCCSSHCVLLDQLDSDTLNLLSNKIAKALVAQLNLL